MVQWRQNNRYALAESILSEALRSDCELCSSVQSQRTVPGDVNDRDLQLLRRTICVLNKTPGQLLQLHVHEAAESTLGQWRDPLYWHRTCRKRDTRPLIHQIRRTSPRPWG